MPKKDIHVTQYTIKGRRGPQTALKNKTTVYTKFPFRHPLGIYYTFEVSIHEYRNEEAKEQEDDSGVKSAMYFETPCKGLLQTCSNTEQFGVRKADG